MRHGDRRERSRDEVTAAPGGASYAVAGPLLVVVALVYRTRRAREQNVAAVRRVVTFVHSERNLDRG